MYAADSEPQTSRSQMTDILYLLATLGFFALAWAYARGCEHI